MSDGMFIVRDDGTLVAMRASLFESEDVFQTLLAAHPSLLAGDALNPESPRRWLLVAREQAVPGEEGGAGRWALDHLFVDQDGVPTLVEVKRASDTRGRREVVAQMLNYAANGVVYWPAEALRRQFATQRGYMQQCTNRTNYPTGRLLRHADSACIIMPLWHWLQRIGSAIGQGMRRTSGWVLILLVFVGIAYEFLPKEDICSDKVRGFQKTASSNVDGSRSIFNKISAKIKSEQVYKTAQLFEKLRPADFTILQTCDTQCALLTRCLRFVFLTPPSQACPREYNDFQAQSKAASELLAKL